MEGCLESSATRTVVGSPQVVRTRYSPHSLHFAGVTETFCGLRSGAGGLSSRPLKIISSKYFLHSRQGLLHVDNLCHERYHYSWERRCASALRRRYDLGSIKAELGLRHRDKMSDNKDCGASRRTSRVDSVVKGNMRQMLRTNRFKGLERVHGGRRTLRESLRKEDFRACADAR